MTPQGRALLWKEWREWRATLLVSNLAIIPMVMIASICERWSPGKWALDSVVLVVMAFAQMAAILAAIWVSDSVCREISSCIQHHPISLRKFASFRLTSGMVVLSLPFLTVGLLESISLWAIDLGWLPVSSQSWLKFQPIEQLIANHWLLMAMAGLPVLLLYQFLAVVGLGLRHPSHVGFIGAAIVILSGLICVTGFADRVLDLPVWTIRLMPSGVLTPGVEPSPSADLAALLGFLLLQTICSWVFVHRTARLRPAIRNSAVRSIG